MREFGSGNDHAIHSGIGEEFGRISIPASIFQFAPVAELGQPVPVQIAHAEQRGSRMARVKLPGKGLTPGSSTDHTQTIFLVHDSIIVSALPTLSLTNCSKPRQWARQWYRRRSCF